MAAGTWAAEGLPRQEGGNLAKRQAKHVPKFHLAMKASKAPPKSKLVVCAANMALMANALERVAPPPQ